MTLRGNLQIYWSVFLAKQCEGCLSEIIPGGIKLLHNFQEIDRVEQLQGLLMVPHLPLIGII